MALKRATFTLPEDVEKALRGLKNKSAFVVEALREKLAFDRQAADRARLAAAYEEASREDPALAEDWDSAVGDGL